MYMSRTKEIRKLDRAERSQLLESFPHVIIVTPIEIKGQCIASIKCFFPFFSAAGYLELIFKNPPSILTITSFVQSVHWLASFALFHIEIFVEEIISRIAAIALCCEIFLPMNITAYPLPLPSHPWFHKIVFVLPTTPPFDQLSILSHSPLLVSCPLPATGILQEMRTGVCCPINRPLRGLLPNPIRSDNPSSCSSPLAKPV